jgi:hypothetical protein
MIYEKIIIIKSELLMTDQIIKIESSAACGFFF